MKRIPVISVISFLIVFFVFTPSLLAGYPTFVIGGGSGIQFPVQDTVFEGEHRTSQVKDESITLVPFNYSVFLEWYMSNHFAVGLKQSVNMRASLTDYDDTSLKEAAFVSHSFLTATWFYYDSLFFGHFGFFCGVGPSSYTYYFEETHKTGSTETSVEENYTVEGLASIAGAFYDIGRGSWGARFGVNAVKTQYDELVIPAQTSISTNSFTSGEHEIRPDASGLLLDFSIRYIF